MNEKEPTAKDIRARRAQQTPEEFAEEWKRAKDQQPTLEETMQDVRLRFPFAGDRVMKKVLGPGKRPRDNKRF